MAVERADTLGDADPRLMERQGAHSCFLLQEGQPRPSGKT